MYPLKYDPDVCRSCPTVDCLTRCQYMDLDLDAAREAKDSILAHEYTPVLSDCATCYACEEYCPNGNHPFYQLVDLQEELGVNPVPVPITKEQVVMMRERGDTMEKPVTEPLVDMCFFPMLEPTIGGPLYEGATTVCGSDIFCNVMWLHFARNSVIRERLPRVIGRINDLFVEPSGVKEVVCYHDECYGTFTQLAPAFGMDVPFTPVHLFEYLDRRLGELDEQGRLKKLNATVAYQRPCSSRLSPQIRPYVDSIFEKIGVSRPQRKYDRENALCCGGVIYASQRDDMADDIQEKNLADMQKVGAQYCVFNCPFCMFTLGDAAAERGMVPILMSDLCRMAAG
ncbi:MAG: heterodisulfide reductase-related iron-sulfur binding cluster [Desulfatibacillaceae bacterium]